MTTAIEVNGTELHYVERDRAAVRVDLEELEAEGPCRWRHRTAHFVTQIHGEITTPRT